MSIETQVASVPQTKTWPSVAGHAQTVPWSQVTALATQNGSAPVAAQTSDINTVTTWASTWPPVASQARDINSDPSHGRTTDPDTVLTRMSSWLQAAAQMTQMTLIHSSNLSHL